jgi:hypothetical protein
MMLAVNYIFVKARSENDDEQSKGQEQYLYRNKKVPSFLVGKGICPTCIRTNLSHDTFNKTNICLSLLQVLLFVFHK